MGLRDLYATDASLHHEGCRTVRWVHETFQGDDADFMFELLESNQPTDGIQRWLRRQSIVPCAKDSLNDHRLSRCTCAPDVRGRRGTA